MPITNYSVLQGRPTGGKVVSGSSAHYQITVEATAGPFTVAVNIQSVDGSEVLYAMEKTFTPPMPLTNVASGITALPSKAGGLALDFVRETIAGKPMITKAEMTLLPTANDTATFVAEIESGESLKGRKDEVRLRLCR